MMKSQGFNAHTKYRILQHALKGDSVTNTCQLFGISRTTYYNWLSAYQRFGIAGLENKEAKKPRMPNKVSKAIEREILAYVAKYPKDGPRRIYYELKAEGIYVGETGIYNVLQRNNLTKRKQRQEYAIQRATKEKKGKDKIPTFSPVEQSYPGYLVLQRIDFIGTFDKIGRVYQYCFYDTNSKWGEIKLYNRKQDIDIWDYFESKLVYLLETFNLTIENLVSERVREFLPYFVKGEQYNRIMDHYHVQHYFVSPEHREIFQDIMDFHEWVVREFYNKIPFNKKLDSFAKVEQAVSNFSRKYNFTHIITQGPNRGKTPAEAVLDRAIKNGTDLDTLPLWLLALINSPRRGVRDEQKG